MTHSIHIAGRSSVSLALILDTLLEKYGNDAINVTVISNVSKPDDIEFRFDQAEHLTLTELTSQQWDGKFDRLLLGAIQVKTKRAIIESFEKSHGIRAKSLHRLVHPAAVVAHGVRLDPGVQIGPISSVAPFTSIGVLTTLSRHVSVGHHTEIGEFCTLNPGCNIAGHCRVGNDVTIGMGANVLDHITIGDNTVVGAGALVNKSLPSNARAWGVPAKVVDL